MHPKGCAPSELGAPASAGRNAPLKRVLPVIGGAGGGSRLRSTGFHQDIVRTEKGVPVDGRW